MREFEKTAGSHVMLYVIRWNGFRTAGRSMLELRNTFDLFANKGTRSSDLGETRPF